MSCAFDRQRLVLYPVFCIFLLLFILLTSFSSLAHEEDIIKPPDPDAEEKVIKNLTTPTEPIPQIVKDFSVVKAFAIDPTKDEKGEISYTLLEPARVRIVITAKGDGDQLYRILLWDRREAGKHVEIWDGLDQSGYPLKPLDCSIGITFSPKSQYRPGTKKLQPLTTAELVMGLQGLHDHNTCDAQACAPSELKFVQLGSSDSSAGNLDTLSGLSIIKVKALEGHRGYGNTSGYGVRWMVDYNLVHAEYYEKECGGKFELKLDTTNFSDGSHVLTVSSCDHYDHIGVVSKKVFFKNTKGK